MQHLTFPDICSRFLLILHLLSHMRVIFTMSFNETKCLELSEKSECECAYKLDTYSITCPGMNIRIVTSDTDYTQIKCTQLDEIENNSVFKTDIGNCDFVEITACQFPISHMLDRLGIKNVKRLFVLDNNFGENLNRLLTGLNGLQELVLYFNNLTRLPVDLFINLSSITTLSLSENLVELPQHIFDPLENLTQLGLSKSNLQQLPGGIFQKQNKLKLLYLDSNRLSNINKAAFEGAVSLQLLDLSNNSIESLAPDVFSLLPNLTVIALYGNNLRELPSNLFANNENLTILHIDGNSGLKLLPSALFANLQHLQEVQIKCNYNQSLTLPASSMVLKNVREMFYTSCDIREIPVDFFNISTNWTSISLADNELSLLPLDIFTDQHNLRILDLSYNKLKSLDRGLFRDTINLEALNLAHNQLTDFADGIFDPLGELLLLFLSNNILHSLPDELFRETSNLIELNLSYNQLTSISEKIFSPLVNLGKLYLDNNHLMTIDYNAFSKSLKIHYISMENNQINFKYFQYVEGIDLFVPIASPFRFLVLLQTLKLRNNLVQDIYWDWKKTLRELKELDLSFNNITKLHCTDLIFAQDRVTVNLSHNRVRVINFDGFEKFQQQEFSIPIKPYNIVNLNYNPLVCDCKLLPFLVYSRGVSLPKMNLITDNLFCNKSDDIKHRIFRELKPEDLLCSIKQPHCPLNCNCWERTSDATLIVNCSNINLAEMPALPDLQTLTLTSIELYVENTELQKLPTKSLPGYAAVKKIYAAGNNIFEIDINDLPAKLTYLDLSRNNLERLNANIIDLLNQSHSPIKLSLAGNPLICDCQNQPLLQSIQSLFYDFDLIYCATPKNYTISDYLKDIDICRNNQHASIILIASILSISLFISITVAIQYKYKAEIKVWLYSYPWLRRIVSEYEVDKNRKYDAFISFSHKDVEFIGKILVPELEQNGPILYKLCVHLRDFIVGERISLQIVRAIDESKRTIIVLSKHFVESVWTCMEYRLALQAAANEKRTRIIVIMYGDIGDFDLLDPLLRAYLKTNTYLEWGDPWFWHRLRYAMPHPVNGPPVETYEYQVTTAV